MYDRRNIRFSSLDDIKINNKNKKSLKTKKTNKQNLLHNTINYECIDYKNP